MLAEKFKNHLQKQFQLQPAQTKCLLAVSGGIDSVVLTDLIHKAGFDFIIAHCNFQLRGAESNRDKAFVLSLQSKYNKPVFVKQFDTQAYASENKLSIQEAARALRYQWFQQLASEKFYAINYKILTAHNANDNIETLMMHFFRGTGLHGLTGIPAMDNERKIIRPLLFAKREAIATYAKENNLEWVEDSSNATDKYTRNYFRLQLLPAIKEVFENVEDNLLHNLERFNEAEQLYNASVQLHLKKLIIQKGNELHVAVLKLQKTIPLNTIIWELVKPYGFSMAQIGEVVKLLNADNGSYISSATHRIIRNRAWLILAPLQTENAQHVLIEAMDKKVVFERGVLKLSPVIATDYTLQNDRNIAAVNADEIKFPLLLRKWKQGDYFYPLGMQKKKKLSKFFIDLKLSKTEKENVWVIESDKRIVWVVNYRIDNRFRFTDKTTNVLLLEYKPG